ncbi:hypothetical protein CMI47_21860 [Candidatus Pacearchaeota archaeon]|nr:hypothetical protein [Candidatus Pacearchaeota archaeon]|tara:strand:- start:787 stop:1356 length:570 start_codon:yes stop_codon:yes gene_type:complete
MRHVWAFDEWSCLRLDEIREALLQKATDAPRLRDITLGDLCCLAVTGECPVGLYVFIDDDGIAYAGKTHGRSLHERIVSHVEHRMPIAGTPHLARLAQSLIKVGAADCGVDAVNKILDMRILWLPVPSGGMTSDEHKQFIACIERRLLWSGCLDPRLNSVRVKHNSTYSLRGKRYQLKEEIMLGDPLSV